MPRRAALALLLLLGGCVVVPIPLGEGHVATGREVPPALLAAVTPGVTTRAQAIAALGEPAAIWAERDVLIWQWDRVRWLLLWAVGGAGGAAAGAADLPDQHMVLAQFDRTGVLRRFAHVERPLMQGYGDFLRRWADAPGDADGNAAPRNAAP